MTATEALETARALTPKLAARAERYDREGAFPAEDIADLRAAGLMALLTPRRLGGAGASFADYTEVAMALAEGNGSTALIYNMHASVTGALALTPDSVARALGAAEDFFAMRDRVLAATADRAAFYAVAMSERGVGSRLSQVRTSYAPDGQGWRIRGSKTFCSGAGHADGYLVAARRAEPPAGGTGAYTHTGTSADAGGGAEPGGAEPGGVAAGDPAGGTATVSYFLVPAVDGLTVEETWDALGMRATASHDLHLDVVVPHDALLGGVEGLTTLMAQIMPQWLVASYAAVYVGVAQAALDAAASHGTHRGLSRLPAVRARLGRADAAVAGAREVVREAARRVDADPGTPETNRWIWRAKLLAGETAMDVAASMLEAAGAAATRRGDPLERLYRDARCGSLQPATSDVCADWLGCAALGMDPERDAEVSRW